LQMDGIPPSHVSNRMEGLTLENPTPPRTPGSFPGQPQQRGAKRRASSPSEGPGGNSRRSPVGGYTPRLSPTGSIRSGAFSSVSRGPGSSISTSTSSTNTGWSSYPSNVSAQSAASSIHNDRAPSAIHPIPPPPIPPTEHNFNIESKSLTPRSFVTVREREIQPAKPESSELAAPPRPGRFNGFSYICDCCPKKPKKFETQAELE
jgi:hypothetical protein